METALRHGGDVQAWTRENGALVEAQPGISEHPPRNRSTVLKRVLASAEVKVSSETTIDSKATYLLSIP
jgi:hypothetical protein